MARSRDKRQQVAALYIYIDRRRMNHMHRQNSQIQGGICARTWERADINYQIRNQRLLAQVHPHPAPRSQHVLLVVSKFSSPARLNCTSC